MDLAVATAAKAVDMEVEAAMGVREVDTQAKEAMGDL